MGGQFIDVVDSYLSAAGNRRITLVRRVHHTKPWIILVELPRRTSPADNNLVTSWIQLSTSEYATEECARDDFEKRRPTFRVSDEEVPMQRGKRLVQEMLEEKLRG